MRILYKNKIHECHYKSDDPYKDYSNLDAASLAIMMKLTLSFETSNKSKANGLQILSPSHIPFSSAIWDMSSAQHPSMELLPKQCSEISQETVDLKITV